MKPLIVLITVFAISIIVNRIATGNLHLALSGRIAMSSMLLFTAIGHFAFTKGMVMMLPDFIPFKIETVYLTGMIEVIAAIGLLLPRFQTLTGWLLIVFFICILPANVHAALNHVNYQKATFDGSGLSYLWFRIPLQILFILWTYFSTIQSK